MANLRIAELDFDAIKTNLKNFLRAQDEFTDYDFEGSGLSVLIDLLAYNTHYNAYLANMVSNEMFLDSAVKRSSALSIAKHLGYTPRSTRSARAVLNVTVNNPTGLPNSITIDRYTPFAVTLDGTAYSFYNLNAVTTTQIDGNYIFNNLEVVEGTPLTITYVVANPGPDEKFEIPSSSVDTSTLLVTVQTSATDTSSSTYTLASDITGINDESKVYFIEENPFEKYQIFFGDGVIGKKLTAGNIITIRYLSSSGSDPNSSNITTQSFTTSTIAGSSDVEITTITNPYNGSEKEGIGSIKFNAPRINAAKNRAVTSKDYEALISSYFTDAESISVWGGEENLPPVYGKVFISLKPYDGFTISQTTKDNILNEVLVNRKVLAIQPEFVDPEYFYVNLDIQAEYNTNLTTKSDAQIEDNISTALSDYFKNDLQKFNKDFNKAKLTKLILEADNSIVSVIIKIKLQKRESIFLNTINSFIEDGKIEIQNAVVPGTVVSSRFYVDTSNTQVLANFNDLPDTMPPSETGTGTIRLVNSVNKSVINSNIGSINYGTGVVTIESFIPTALPNGINDFRVTASIQESSHNLKVYRNQILILDDSAAISLSGRDAGVTINATPITE